jgi:predicted hydrocarbon binding protein
MNDAGVGRLLVASLHQGIADLLPTRLEFYEAWLNPAGLREGRIGLAPLAAVLSFLRQEGEPYHMVAIRAGKYTAEWTVADLSPTARSFIGRMPPAIRLWLVMRLARRMIKQTYGGSRAIVRWRRGKGAVDVRGSIFCGVREPVEQPLCAFYSSAIGRLMDLFTLDVDVGTERCRATGAGQCIVSMLIRRPGKPAQ